MSLSNLVRSWFKTLSARRLSPVGHRGRRPARATPLSLLHLEDRLTPTGNLAVTDAFLVDENEQRITAPVTPGQHFYVEVDYTTQNLPADASYRIATTVNGETVYSDDLTWGAGVRGTTQQHSYWGWFVACPGVNQVAVAVNPDRSMLESRYSDNTESFTFNASGPPTSWETYSVAQIRNAYGLNSLPNFGIAAADGSGQTIAIVDAGNDPYILSDLDGFDRAMTLTLSSKQSMYQQYGPASSFVTVYNQYGQDITASIANSGSNGVPDEDPTGSWEGEETMDVEWAHAIAPGARIAIIETDYVPDDILDQLGAGDLLAPTLPGVSVVSNSFQSVEWSIEADSDFIFTTPAGHTGVTFLASSGDYGSNYYWNGAVDDAVYPSASPNVVSVGGTQLTLNNNGYGSETGWSYAAPATTVANGSSGYAQAGTWTAQPGGFSGTTSSASGGSSATATWTIPVTPTTAGWNGTGPEVSATWTASPGNATNATYSVYDGTTGTLLGTVVVDQTQTPKGTAVGATQFQELGVFTPALDANGDGSLRVVLDASTANGTADADAIGIALDWATTGGPSVYEPEPTYQQSVQNTGSRATPDVSFDGSIYSGVTVYQTLVQDPSESGIWYNAAGTSLSSPCWAGLIAIANQGRVAAGGTTFNSPDNPQQTLQALYSLPSGDFHDVTTGYNGFEAGQGYDMVTGRGTPIANRLIPDLVTYGMAPTVAHVSPAAGPTAGGETVTITGTNFLGATAVAFGGVAATSFTVVSGTEIRAVVPAHAAGAVDVTVTTPGGTTTVTRGDRFTYVAPPTITSLSKSSGSVLGGTVVTITGTNLSGAVVMFGPLPGLIVSESSTRIVVISPPDWPGTVAVTVTTTGGTSATSAADEFTYLPLWDFLGGIDLGDGFDWPGGDHHHG
jgi:hypothetical protein